MKENLLLSLKQFPELHGKIEDLFKKGVKLYLACTGAGSGITDLIWQVAGASSTLIGSSFPYNQKEFDLFIGCNWNNFGHGYCSKEASIALAQESYFRAQKASIESGDKSPTCIGIGLSATTQTTRILKGGTRAFITLRSDTEIKTVEIFMEQGYLGRIGDGLVCDISVLNLILNEVGIDQIPLNEELRLISNNFEIVSDDNFILKPEILKGLSVDGITKKSILIDVNGNDNEIALDPKKHIIFPGSFNPLHFGHDGIARRVELLTGKKVVFEITGRNARKDALEIDSLLGRAWQFRNRWPIIITETNGMFIDKARAYGCEFIIGFDTLKALLNREYYPVQTLENAFEEMRTRGVIFYVFSRDGENISNIEIPTLFRDMFFQLNGRWDVSSTNLRKV